MSVCNCSSGIAVGIARKKEDTNILKNPAYRIERIGKDVMPLGRGYNAVWYGKYGSGFNNHES